MTLCWIEVHNVRNISSVKLKLNPRFNLFLGKNGAGKTSLLEAVYLLGRGQSFRSNDVLAATTRGATSCTVTAKIALRGVVGVELTKGGLTGRINGEPLRNRAALAEFTPLLFIGPDSHRFVTEGPELRRKLIDWGVFHVEPNFISLWRQYQHILKQRNVALKLGHPVDPWDNAFIEVAERLDACRYSYINQLLSYVQHYVEQLLQINTMSYQYVRGWREDMTIGDVLKANLEHDRVQGFTRFGPHRADLHIKCDTKPVKDILSRGQQKLLVNSLHLAQVALLTTVINRPCTLLIDDLASELDIHHRERLIELLADMNVQVLLTTVVDWKWPLKDIESCTVFHVEQGRVTSLK